MKPSQRPVIEKEHLDEDLIALGILPVKVGIDNIGENPFYFIFDLHGQVEQPRIKKVADDEKDMK